MARLVYHSQPPLKFTTSSIRPWVPTAAVWGVGAGLYGLYFLSVTPLVKRGFLSKIPVLGEYFEDKTPPTDKPF